MKSALFVDFDNVFSSLKALQPAAAERFAGHPIEWLRWMTQTLELPEPHTSDAARRVLVRRCYLNPNWYQHYRHAFLRAGFEIIDCPPVTSQGKTSTDIHMVLDIIELLQHEIHYDEFIVLSADADFTPVLRKLRRFDRRTSVLAIGFPSSAYMASADLLIDERSFIEQALGLAGEVAEKGASPVPAPLRVLEPPAKGVQVAPIVVKVMPAMPATCAPGPTPSDASGPSASRVATSAELTRITATIRSKVAASPVPLAAGFIAAQLRVEFPAALGNWNGHTNFKSFFHSLSMHELDWLSGSGGRIADPERHVVNSDLRPQPVMPVEWKGYEALLPVARDVCQLTGAPLVSPPEIHALLAAICEDVAVEDFELTTTAHRAHESCHQRGEIIDATVRDVMFLLRGMQMNGHVFGRGHDTPRNLARRLFNQVVFLCQREQMVMDEAIKLHIRQWIGGDLIG